MLSNTFIMPGNSGMEEVAPKYNSMQPENGDRTKPERQCVFCMHSLYQEWVCSEQAVFFDTAHVSAFARLSLPESLCGPLIVCLLVRIDLILGQRLPPREGDGRCACSEHEG